MMAARTGSVPVHRAAARARREDRRAREAARHDGADVGRGELEHRRGAPADREGRGRQCALGDRRRRAACRISRPRAASASRNSSTARVCAARSSSRRHRIHEARREGRRRRGRGRREAPFRSSRSASPKAAISKIPETAPYAQRGDKQWGGLTPLLFAAREGNLETVKVLLDAGADVNQTSEYGWTALLMATQNRYYQLGVYLLERGADPNLANEGGWNPLYLATDNRNIEARRLSDAQAGHGSPGVHQAAAGRRRESEPAHALEHRDAHGVHHQWLYEEGATPFLRAAQSGDVVLMKLLLEHGADPSIPTDHKVTPLMVASGIGWVEGVTYEWSPQATVRRREAAARARRGRECAGHSGWPHGADGRGAQRAQRRHRAARGAWRGSCDP